MWCTKAMCCMRFFFVSGSHWISMAPMKPSDTAIKASLGQLRNQSSAQPLMRPGNLRARSANLALTGEKHKTTCRFWRTVSKKFLTRKSGVSE